MNNRPKLNTIIHTNKKNPVANEIIFQYNHLINEYNICEVPAERINIKRQAEFLLVKLYEVNHSHGYNLESIQDTTQKKSVLQKLVG